MGTCYSLLCHECKEVLNVGKMYVTEDEENRWKPSFAMTELYPITDFLNRHQRHALEFISEHEKEPVEDANMGYKGKKFHLPSRAS